MQWKVKGQHVIPLDDLKEHIESEDCWCRPREDDEVPGLMIHNSMDRREQYEIQTH